jgi:hypothetical protein
VGRDPGQATGRVYGGIPTKPGAAKQGRSAGDAEATSGPGENGLFVGRVAGQDSGYAEESGAERRAHRRAHQDR